MSLWQDLRFAVRMLLKDRWFTAVAAVALVLGIGVNTTVFTLAAVSATCAEISGIVARSPFGGSGTGIAIYDQTGHRSLYHLHARSDEVMLLWFAGPYMADA